jgi:hypothetical protein
MKTNSRAFVLVYVIALIGIVGVTMGSLTMGLRMSLIQTNRFHLAAVEHNLFMSALAWSQHSLGDPNSILLQHDPNAAQPITLDANSLFTRPCSITIRASRPDGDAPTLHVNTTCTYGRQTLKKSQGYIISPENQLSELPSEVPLILQ